MSNYDPTILEGLFSETELLSMRASLVATITGSPGREIQSVQTRDLSTVFAPGTPAHVMLAAVQYALYKLKPETYKKPSLAKVKSYYAL